jgi:cytochrome c oxidase subunit 3
MAAAVEHLHDDDHHEDHGHALSWPVQLRANRLGIWLFCFSELFLFAALLAARFYLWRDGGDLVRPELSQTAALITTSVLLLSSYFMIRAEIAAGHADWKKMDTNLLWTFFFGLLFLIGLFFVEWGIIPNLAMALTGEAHVLRPTDGVFGAVFFMMTGMHAAHVIIGLVFIGTVIRNGRKGNYTVEKHWGVESCAIFWHYVDVIWIFFYPALYLIGRAMEFHH